MALTASQKKAALQSHLGWECWGGGAQLSLNSGVGGGKAGKGEEELRVSGQEGKTAGPDS